jgi:DNA-binding response OmpR family regulator
VERHSLVLEQAGLDPACPAVLSSAGTMAAENPLKVLIAEDEPSMLSLVARHVRGLGFTVVEAPDGDAAWELAQQHHPDLVILDVMMPGMSGWEVCKRIKAASSDGVFAATGVIMLTGIGENLNDMTSPLFAADTWLNKPFDFADLEARIAETLGQYGKARAAAAEQPVKKTAKKKTVAKKKAGAKKTVAKKAVAKKAVAKKTVAKKAVAKKAVAKKAVAKKAVPKKAAAKKRARSK